MRRGRYASMPRILFVQRFAPVLVLAYFPSSSALCFLPVALVLLLRHSLPSLLLRSSPLPVLSSFSRGGEIRFHRDTKNERGRKFTSFLILSTRRKRKEEGGEKSGNRIFATGRSHAWFGERLAPRETA